MSEKGELRLKLVNQTVEAMAKSVPNVMYKCTLLLVMNQCIKVPSGGIIFGYFFVLRDVASSSLSFGPGYLGASFSRLLGCEGGVNFAGFSSTRGLDFFVDLLDA